MNYLEFFLFAEDHLESIILFSCLVTLGYLFLYRKYIQSIFDPFFLIIFIAGLATSTVFFLYFNGAIKSEYFFQFIATELSFIIGFFLIKPIKFSNYLQKEKIRVSGIFGEQFADIVFYLSSIVHIVLQFLTYVIVGIPLLLDSRMETFAGGSGFGVVGRIIEVTSVLGIFLLFYRIFYAKKYLFGKFYNMIYLILVVLFLLLSGSKTNLIFLVYYLFFLNLYMSKIRGVDISRVIKKISKYQKLLLYSSIPLIFLVMYIQFVNSGSTQDQVSPLLAFGQRIISFGDIYYMTFPQDVIMAMNHDSGFLQLFKDPLGMMRIVPWSNLPKDCGIEIYEYHYPNGTLSGPNARYNYFAILYFGLIGQVIFCFILGLITSFLRNTLFRVLPNNIIFGAIYTLFSINLIYIFQDQAFTIARYFNIIVLLPIVLVMALIIQYLFQSNPTKRDITSIELKHSS